MRSVPIQVFALLLQLLLIGLALRHTAALLDRLPESWRSRYSLRLAIDLALVYRRLPDS